MPLTGARLDVQNVGKSYGVRRVLFDFSLSVLPGEVVTVTGANGSGKSTLLKIVAGLLRPTRGSVTFAQSEDVAFRRAQVGYAAPDLALYNELTGVENLRFFDDVRAQKTSAKRDYHALLEFVGLGGRGNDFVAAYSSGMRQRLRLAFALLADAPLLLLDEPSLALDENGVELVGEIVRMQRERAGLTLLATNDAREAALGDRRVAVNDRGVAVKGGARAIVGT